MYLFEIFEYTILKQRRQFLDFFKHFLDSISAWFGIKTTEFLPKIFFNLIRRPFTFQIMNSVRSNLILFYTICSKDIGIKKLEFVLCTLCSIFLIPISLQPDYVDLLRFKLWILWFVRSKIILFHTIRLQRYKK